MATVERRRKKLSLTSLCHHHHRPQQHRYKHSVRRWLSLRCCCWPALAIWSSWARICFVVTHFYEKLKVLIDREVVRSSRLAFLSLKRFPETPSAFSSDSWKHFESPQKTSHSFVHLIFHTRRTSFRVYEILIKRSLYTHLILFFVIYNQAGAYI